MSTNRGWTSFLVTFVGLVLVASASDSETLKPNAKLPDPVAKKFKKEFPKAKIEKIDALEEEGVMVYDFEFRDGSREKETDIAADGTMLEYTLVISPKAIPAPAMKVIKELAKGSSLGRLEEIKISYETKDGKIVKLPELKTHYAAELERGKQTAEVVVTPDGTLIDTPKWPDAKDAKTKSASNAGK